MPSLDDLTLALADWTVASRDAGEAIWTTADGDGAGVYLFDLPPDIGTALRDLDGLRSFYRERVAQAGGAIVQVELARIDGADAIETIIKAPQDPSGMTYVGSLTLPFEAFSFVVKVQCGEHGMTGLRDTMVFASLAPEVDEETGEAIGWMQDPYDPAVVAPLLRNPSDDAVWDEQFPDHPLSRCRRALGQLRECLQLSDSVRAARPFAGPAAPPAKKRSWWPFGRG